MGNKLQDNMYDFLQLVAKNIQEGMIYLDAINLSAVIIGGDIPSIISKATSKYQEVTNDRTEISQQEDIDQLAFASMDELWHEDTVEKDAEISLELEDILAQTIYLILKYAETDNPLAETLTANRRTSGAQEARESMIQLAMNV